MTASISRLTPAPGEGSFLPGMMTQPLPKDGPEVDDFLSRLALVYKVFELEGRACPHALLHPTFYSFCFTDSEGNSHKFDYSIEAGRHHDDTYRELVEEFERFFEVRRVARSLYEDASRPPEPPGRPTWGKRINWWLRFLISRLR